MKRELELRARKLLQEQYKKGSITKRQLNNELDFIKKLKQERNDKTIETNRPETTIQVVQRWSSTITTIPQYQFIFFCIIFHLYFNNFLYSSKLFILASAILK